MPLLVVAYPEMQHEDYLWVQEFRAQHDELYYRVVEPNFTIVFPTFGFSVADFAAEMEERSKDVAPIDFEIKSAGIKKDPFNDYWHVFLQPDQGNGAIVKLHDRLYSGKILDTLMLELSFTSHIGIGNSKDKWHCKQLVDEINATNRKIAGQITHLDIITYENDTVETMKKIGLN